MVKAKRSGKILLMGASCTDGSHRKPRGVCGHEPYVVHDHTLSTINDPLSAADLST
jgi:hypothetical protein